MELKASCNMDYLGGDILDGKRSFLLFTPKSSVEKSLECGANKSRHGRWTNLGLILPSLFVQTQSILLTSLSPISSSEMGQYELHKFIVKVRFPEKCQVLWLPTASHAVRIQCFFH